MHFVPIHAVIGRVVVVVVDFLPDLLEDFLAVLGAQALFWGGSRRRRGAGNLRGDRRRRPPATPD